MPTLPSVATGVSRGVESPADESSGRLGVESAICGLGMAAAGANVIMQLSMLPVGHGVATSTVASGRVDQHPIKRMRTTVSYLAVALLGTDDERDAFRREVNRSHRPVHSAPDDPVPYDAFDTDLQLWVAACLYKGFVDVYELLHGEPDAETGEAMYRYCSRLGTTLQVRPGQWPADRAAFAEYWDDQVERIEMDDVTRPYLQGVAGAQFLGPPYSWLVGVPMRLLSVGFLPPEFREELGLPWDAGRQRVFDAFVATSASVMRVVPRPLRQFPFNLYLADARRRIRSGRAIV